MPNNRIYLNENCFKACHLKNALLAHIKPLNVAQVVIIGCPSSVVRYVSCVVNSSIGATLAFLTSLPVQDGGPHDTKMAAPTTSGPRWRPPRHQDGGPHEVKMAAPVTRSVTPRRVSQRPRPREGSVTS